MKRLRFVLSTACAVALSALVADARGALLVGVNFVGGNAGGAPTSLDPADSTGVVPQANWNNVAGASGSVIAMNDSAGASTPVTLTYAGAGTWGTGTGTATAMAKLFNGYVDGTDNGTNTYTFNGVPAGTYNVYVYSLPDSLDGRDQSVTLTGSTTAKFFSSSDAGAGFANGFVLASATTQDGPGATGNYLKFSNVQPAAGGTFTIVGQSLVFRNFANGIQLQAVAAVPEPSGMCVVAVAAAGLLRRTRRRQA